MHGFSRFRLNKDLIDLLCTSGKYGRGAQRSGKRTRHKTLAYAAMFDRAGPLYLLLDLFGRRLSFWVVLVIELTGRSNGWR